MNVWLKYKDCKKGQVPKKKCVHLFGFKMATGETMVAAPKCGR
jgi:hypothetical protein